MAELFSIARYAIGSLFLGVLLTAAGLALMFWLIKSWRRKSEYTPLSFVVGAVLFCFLSFQAILLCGAVAIKGYTDDVEYAINEAVKALPEDYEFNKNDSQAILNGVSDAWPLVSHYLERADFSGHTPDTIATAMADEMNRWMNWYIARRVGWSLLFVVIGAFVVNKTMDTVEEKRFSRRQSSASRYVYDD